MIFTATYTLHIADRAYAFTAKAAQRRWGDKVWQSSGKQRINKEEKEREGNKQNNTEEEQMQL